MNLWKVCYETQFSSSSGMQRYSTTDILTGYVATPAESLSGVCEAIQRTLDCQTRLVRIITAEFIGTVIVWNAKQNP